MSDIFGYSWDAIQKAQQGDMSEMRRPIEESQCGGEWTSLDQHLLDQHGAIEALEDAGLYGVADRAKRQGRKAS